MRRNDRATSHTKLALSLGAATVVAVAMFAAEAKAQTSGESFSNLEARVEPLRPGVTESQLLAELATHNEERRTALHDYTVLRTYQVVDLKGKVHAEEIGRMEFLSPDKKAFTVTAESGSGLVRHMALNPLINSEIEAAAGKEHHDSAISTDNYSLVRIEGHPATKLSFWIQRADFVRQYQKVDGFWLPETDQTLVQVRLYGKKILKIEHRNYVVNTVQSTNARSTVRETAVTQTN